MLYIRNRWRAKQRKKQKHDQSQRTLDKGVSLLVKVEVITILNEMGQETSLTGKHWSREIKEGMLQASLTAVEVR